MSKVIKSHQPIEQKQVTEIKLRPVVMSNESTEEQSERTLQKQRNDAALILKEAQVKADYLLETVAKEKQQWETEKQQLIEEAQSAGYKDGLEKGYQDSLQQMSSQLDLANNIVEEAHKQAALQLKQAEQDMMCVSFEIAKKVIGQLLEEDSEYFMSLVKTALSEVKENKEVQIVVNVSKYQIVNQSLNELKERLPERTNCTIYASNELSENDCLIETETGRVIASLDDQLHHLKTQLTDMFSGETNE